MKAPGNPGAGGARITNGAGGTDGGAEMQSAVSTKAWVVAQVNTPPRAGGAGRAGWAGRAIGAEGEGGRVDVSYGCRSVSCGVGQQTIFYV